MSKFPYLISLGVLLCATTAWSQGEDLDAASAEALQRTQQLLKESTERAKALSADPKAAAADKWVRDFTGSDADTAEIYSLSADIFGDLIKNNGGDAAKVQEILEKAKKDPESLAKKLRPEQQRKLKEIADRVSAKKQQSKP